MKNYIQKGDTLEFTAGATVTAGDLVLVDTIVGVAVNDVANGEVGVIAVTGVYEVAKEADEIAKGTYLYHKAANGTVTTSSQGNKLAGWAWTAAASGDTTVHLHLIL